LGAAQAKLAFLTADLGGYFVEGEKNLAVVAPSDLQIVILANGGENASRKVNPQTGEKAAIDKGFEFVRIEGYILPATKD